MINETALIYNEAFLEFLSFHSLPSRFTADPQTSQCFTGNYCMIADDSF